MSEELNPITREELFMSAAAGNDVDLPTPETREELYLAKAAGVDVETPDPITRKEMFLDEIAQGGGGGGGATVEPLSVTENGTYTAPEGKAYSPVSVDVQPKEENDVIFYDYDGTILYSYTAEEFLALDQMPEGKDKTDEGLVFKEWNWGWEEARNYVAGNRAGDIGALYDSDDDTDRIYLNIPENEVRRKIGINMYAASANSVAVDWGDGSDREIISTGVSLVSHVYPRTGKFIIKFIQLTNTNTFVYIQSPGSNRGGIYNGDVGNIYGTACANWIDKIFINTALYPNRYTLKNVSLKNIIYSSKCGYYLDFRDIETYTKIKHITLNKRMNLSQINNTSFSFPSLESLSLPFVDLGSRLNSIMSSLYIKRFCLTKINSSAQFPITYGLKAFNIYLPIGITTLPTNFLYFNLYISKFVIPNTVTELKTGCFEQAYYLKEIHLKSETPPTLAGGLGSLSNDCVIYVPAGSLEDYQEASNWSNYADIMVEEGE